MPTQNPHAWVGMGMGTQCRALVGCHFGSKVCGIHVHNIIQLHGCVPFHPIRYLASDMGLRYLTIPSWEET